MVNMDDLNGIFWRKEEVKGIKDLILKSIKEGTPYSIAEVRRDLPEVCELILCSKRNDELYVMSIIPKISFEFLLVQNE